MSKRIQRISDNNFMLLYNKYKLLALNLFEWDGLPDTCDVRYLERALCWNGKAVYCRDDDLGADLTLKVALGGNFDVYGIPTQRECYGQNGYTIQRDPSNSVVIWNNMAHRPTFQWLTNFAMRMYDLDRTIDVNARAQKTPVLVTCDENERLSFENIYTQFDGNRPVIYGSKALNKDNIQVLRTDAPYVSDKIYQLKVNIWNEAMACLGIANLAMQKKERLISSEVTQQMGGTLAQRYSFVQARQEAADKINKMFGTNITVKFRDGDMDEAGEEAPIMAINDAQEGAPTNE